MSLPPVPARPYDAAPTPDLRFESAPHYDNPLAAPRPHRVDPAIGANMARDLELQPGFTQPRTASALPPPQGSSWSPWAPVAAGSAGSTTTFTRTPSPLPPRLPSPPRDGALTVPLPSVAALSAALPTVTHPSHDPALQLAWARDVLFLVDRTVSPNLLPTSPLALAAVPLILALASASPPLPEAVHLRATFASSGQFPQLVEKNPRAAFRDFEAAARAGHAPAWFRLARDYEAFSDTPHALDCLARGAKANDPAALHRLGIAHLLSQLALPTDPVIALPLLHRAAQRANLHVPQPAYVFALILLNEFSVPVDASLLLQFLPSGNSPSVYARALLERAAQLHFAPAQYKLGHAFEFASPAAAFPFEPLLSVQWYSLASQAGEAEADMALSKWFLCGAEGAFDKDETLARTFAGKAAAKALPSGEFAMGYYAEVGIGGAKNLGEARGWYEKAAAHGNTDAVDRLAALTQAAPQALSRTEHDAITEHKLVRKRTQAKQRSDAGFPGAGDPVRPDGRAVMELVRKSSLADAGPRPPREASLGQQARPMSQAAGGGGRGGYALQDSARPASAGSAPQQQGGSRPGSAGAGGRAQGVPPGRRPGGVGTPGPGPGPVVTSPHGGTGPATFAEMGFTGAKAEDKECVIM
ncbi:hypothetical protein C8J57DRAFT_1177748 [Mycena rebaudengoi]|nr:hypothetical protein C8J57DRAFT_1177748 [Mycena rebaudengoi]